MLIRKIAIAIFTICFFSILANAWPWGSDSVSRIRLTWSEDPSTSMKIIWDTDTRNGEYQTLYFDTIDHGRTSKSYRYSTKLHKFDRHKGMYNAVVHLRGLKPDTKYFFVIKTSRGEVSKRYWFKTINDQENTRLSIIAGGDSRNNRTPRLAANLLVSKLRADFVLFGGDMTNLDFSRQWKKWFDDWQRTISPDGRITPIIVARGNHERSNRSISELFDTSSQVYYSLSFADKLLTTYILNTEVSVSGNQRRWLNDELAENEDSIWKIGIYHRPMRPHTAKKSENDRLYQAWAPLFFQYGVNLVIESDSHTVKSTYPIRPSYELGHDEGFVRDDVNGTVYVGEGCWGAPLRVSNDDKSWTRSSGSFNQFRWIHLDKERMDIRTIVIDNANDVEAVVDSKRFHLPRKLKIWNPKEGAVLSLESRK